MDDEDIDEAIPISSSTATVKKEKVQRKRGKKVAVEEDDLDGFIVDDKDEPPKKRAKTTRARKTTKSPSKEEEGKEAAPVTVVKRKVAGAYRPKWLGAERDPPKHGSKPIPVGKDGCLSGIIFVLTGLNESLNRDETIELITRYGGIIRSAVSGKTQYLVAGFEMEDGRPITEGSKYRAAKEKKVPIISEDDLLQMIRRSNPEASAKSEAAQKAVLQKEEKEAVGHEESIMGDRTTQSSRLLTVKYAPRRVAEILGNTAVIEHLQLWLTQWEDVVIKSGGWLGD